jgi:hypothetical protein
MANSQEVPLGVKIELPSAFFTDWIYFRMLKNPLLSYEDIYRQDGLWESPYHLFLPEKMLGNNYDYDVKISCWGKSKTANYQYIDIRATYFYLIEKNNGLLGLKRSYFPEAILDSVQLNIYDGIFPYDNHFLAVRERTINEDNYKFTFHSGNVQWGTWKDAGFIRRVDYCGYIRGVQFGIENVFQFRQGFSDKIKQFRPEYPDYVYTCNRYRSLLTPVCVIIGAPQGKEDQLIEYIYYTNNVGKTGDTDESHYYEMRYILPTQIQSIKERRLEKRLLSDEEKKYILNEENKMHYYIERKEASLNEESVIIDGIVCNDQIFSLLTDKLENLVHSFIEALWVSGLFHPCFVSRFLPIPFKSPERT